jgi:hypothetical protein
VDPVSIANLALSWLGLDPIVSLEDDSKSANKINANFAPIRDAVLEDRDWTFAMERFALNKEAEAPAFGYTAKYLLPAKVLRGVTANDDGGTVDAFAYSVGLAGSSRLDWVKEGRSILANTTADTVNILAVVQVEDVALWSPGFCQAVAARLAADLCVPLTENRSLQADLWKLYTDKLRDAAANDGRQGRSPRLRNTTLAARRR